MKRFITKRTLVASLLGLTAFGAVFGSAATLGGLSSDQLGADTRTVASCDTDGVAVTYTEAYEQTAPAGYKVTDVTVTGVASACAGQTLSVTLSGAGDQAVGEGSITVPASGTDHVVAISSHPLAQDVTRADVVITG
jgi:hypothetical protein